MKTFNQFRTELEEMARSLGSSYSRLGSYEKVRKETFNNTKDLPKHNYQIDNNDISIQIKSSPDEDHIVTNDHKTGETLHRSLINHYPPNENLPFEHDKQNEVERARSDKLPKGHAKNVIYDYMKNSNRPLVSSSTQYIPGHWMWKDLAHRALNDNLHVYYHDGKTLHKSNKDNIHEHLYDYLGDDPEYENKHIIISKKEL